MVNKNLAKLLAEAESEKILELEQANIKLLKQLEKSMAAGLDEIEVFPINFVQAPDDIYKVLKIISEVRKS